MSRWYDLLAGSTERKYRDRDLEKLFAQPGERILEIGFGTGHCLVSLSRAVGSDGRVIGVDISDGMTGIAMKRLRQSGLNDRVDLHRADASHLDFLEADSIDGIFKSFTLELFDTPDIPCVLQEYHRVLRTGGRLIVVCMVKTDPPGMPVRVYEWFHDHIPHYADCRPIFAQSLQHIIVQGKPGKGMHSFQALLSQDWGNKFGPGFLEKYFQDHPVEADDLLEIAYTSGTTGRPKGVVETHNTRMLHSVGIAERMKATEKDVWLNMTPLFHTTGNCVVQHTAFLTGGALILLGRYSTETSLREIERCRATIAVGVPTMFMDLMNHPRFEKTDVASLRFALFTGAPAIRL